MNNYGIIEQALNLIESSVSEKFSLAKLSSFFGMQADDFSKLFKRFTGISPQRYYNYSRLALLKKMVVAHSLLDVAISSNISSESRIYDLFVTYEAVTPGEFKKGGTGIQMKYGIYDGVLGNTFILTTQRGITGIAFGEDETEFLTDYSSRYPFAEFKRDDSENYALYQELMNAINGKKSRTKLFLIGTNFQIKVWEALLSIPRGNITTYAALATKLGTKGYRAVGTAIGKNPISYLIPCHRVIQGKGLVGGYHWGNARKRILLANEL